MSVRLKLIVAFLLVGMAPLIVATVMSSSRASSALQSATERASGDLESQVERQLVAIRDLKKKSVGHYFDRVKGQVKTFSEQQMVVESLPALTRAVERFRSGNGIGDRRLEQSVKDVAGFYRSEFGREFKSQNGAGVSTEEIVRRLDADAVALQQVYIAKNEHPLGEKDSLVDNPADRSSYRKLHAAIHPIARSYLQEFGYYDIFLVDIASGRIVYSVFKEIDFGTSLTDGPFADSGIGEAFRLGAAASAPGRGAGRLRHLPALLRCSGGLHRLAGGRRGGREDRGGDLPAADRPDHGNPVRTRWHG